MKDLTPKFDDTAGPTGQLTALEFNDFASDVQNAIIESGQTLTAGVGDDNRQLSKAIAVGGKRISRATGETAKVGEVVLPDNSAAPCTINLPPLADLFVNATVYVEQVQNQRYFTHPLTVGANSNRIMGLTEDMLCDSRLSDNVRMKFVWTGLAFGWKLSVEAVLGAN